MKNKEKLLKGICTFLNNLAIPLKRKETFESDLYFFQTIIDKPNKNKEKKYLGFVLFSFVIKRQEKKIGTLSINNPLRAGNNS